MKILLLAVAVAALAGTTALPDSASAAVKPATTLAITSPIEVEQRVRSFFSDVPVMAEIAKCESGFRQFTESGVPLRGGYGGGMIGVFQFYETVHSSAAKALGFDLATLEGNLGYAKHLHSLSGTQPWMSSHDCWKHAALQKPKAATHTSLSTSERKALLARIAELTKLVAQLQKLLAEKQLAAN